MINKWYSFYVNQVDFIYSFYFMAVFQVFSFLYITPYFAASFFSIKSVQSNIVIQSNTVAGKC